MRIECVSRDRMAWGAWISGTLLSVTLFLLPFAIVFSPRAVSAAPCTRGVNCYCDRVKNAANPIHDSSLLVCEDFEAPTLHDNVGFGNGAPDYGPWYDDTGSAGNRGNNSYWGRTYGNGVGRCLVPTGTPANPTLGRTCSSDTGVCSGELAWHPNDLWQANASKPCLAVLKNGEFSADDPRILPPAGASGGGSGVFDGQQTFGHRICPGFDCDQGILGFASFGGARRTFGITMAVAYANNITASGIWVSQWKHNEWHPAGSPGAGGDGIFLFHNTASLTDQVPFEHFMFFGTDNRTSCNSKVAAATVTAGNLFCTDAYFGYTAGSNYKQSLDWPFGTWGCVRGYFQNMGLSNASIQIWLTGPSGIEKPIIDIRNLDLTGTQGRGGYDQLIWNAYVNTNYNNGVDIPTNQTTYRYEDNVHIRAGAPVPCSQIGFSSIAATPPAAPSGLIVQ